MKLKYGLLWVSVVINHCSSLICLVFSIFPKENIRSFRYLNKVLFETSESSLHPWMSSTSNLSSFVGRWRPTISWYKVTLWGRTAEVYLLPLVTSVDDAAVQHTCILICHVPYFIVLGQLFWDGSMLYTPHLVVHRHFLTGLSLKCKDDFSFLQLIYFQPLNMTDHNNFLMYFLSNSPVTVHQMLIGNRNIFWSMNPYYCEPVDHKLCVIMKVYMRLCDKGPSFVFFSIA